MKSVLKWKDEEISVNDESIIQQSLADFDSGNRAAAHEALK